MNKRPSPHDRPILCLDFDGVIHSYVSGWKGVDQIPDPPVPGVFEWMETASKYFRVYVYSSRSSELEGREAMRDYIMKCAGPKLTEKIYFCRDKPHAFLTIDDRAIKFNGNWQDKQYDIEKLRTFHPWNKSGK